MIQPRAMSKQAQRQQRQRFTDSASAYDDAQQQQQQLGEQQGEQQAKTEEDQQYDPLANLLSLQLRKPAHWNWELSTSRSCSNIALPRILLYDHTGQLLVDASGESEQTYRPPPRQQPDRRRKRAATANLAQSLQQARLPSEFHGLQIGEATPSPTRTPTPTRSTTSQLEKQLTGSCIDFSTHELPDWQPRGSSASSRRSSSLRGVRFEDQRSLELEPEQEQEQPRQQQQQQQELSYPTPPSTSTLTTTANSSSSGPREKRRYRRSHSSGQRSILERFSMSRGRHSSPEYVQEEQLEHAPRYFLRTSKAGTLVIKDESFSRVRQRRRRVRHSSSENVLLSQDRSPAGSVVLATSRRQQQQQAQPSQRSREPQLSTSEEEQAGQAHAARPSRSRRNPRGNCGKDVAAQGKSGSPLPSLSLQFSHCCSPSLSP